MSFTSYCAGAGWVRLLLMVGLWAGLLAVVFWAVRRAFDRAGVTVLPIVMNTRAQITADMRTYGVATPFLLDDGKVSTEYKTIGHGMHAGLPGHSFVLIDKDGVQRWYGEYPSMYRSPADLLKQVSKHLA